MPPPRSGAPSRVSRISLVSQWDLPPPCLSAGVAADRRPLPCGAGAPHARPWQGLELGWPPWALEWVQSHMPEPAAGAVAVQGHCLSVLLALGMVLLSPGCSLSVLFLPTEDGHLITPNSVSRQPSHMLPTPCPTPGPLASMPRPFPPGQRDSAALSSGRTDPEAVAALPISCTAGRGAGPKVAGDTRGSRRSLGIVGGHRSGCPAPRAGPPG